MRGVDFINTMNELGVSSSIESKEVDELEITTKIRNNIDNSIGVYPGSDTLKRLISNPKYITSSTVKHLYNCLKFYENKGITTGSSYNDIYNIVLFYERRLLK